MVFTVKKVEELPSFGEKLKKAREEAGLTKEKVAQLLSLPIKYLDYLETEEIEKMPADVYARGFLKKYAKLLEIDEKKLMEDYIKESRIARHLKDQKHQALPALRYRRFVLTPKTLGWCLGIVILFFIISYFFYQLHFLLSPPSLIVFEPNQNNYITESSLIIFRGQTEPGSKLTINGQQSYIDKDGNFEQKITLFSGLNTIKIEAINRFGKATSEIKTIMLK